VIGLVVVTHGRLAEEMIAAVEHVVGPQGAIEAVCIGPDDDMEARRQEIADKIDAMDQGEGVVVLTDMFGGTPSNLAISLLDRGNIEVIAGVNLPLLIKLVRLRDSHGMAEAAAQAQEAGRKYITIASQVLAGDS